jgi:hypothetical protein
MDFGFFLTGNLINGRSLLTEWWTALQIKISTKASVGEGASRDVGTLEEMDISREEVDDPARTATRAELQAGQLSEAEILSLSIVKVSIIKVLDILVLWSFGLVNKL